MAGSIAAVLGVAHAGVSTFWALGGTALLDTVGGEIERWGRERSRAVVATLWLLVAAKLAAAAPLVLAGVGAGRLPTWTRSRRARGLGWVTAGFLAVYGGLLTSVGLLVQAKVIRAADDADRHALEWHTYVWDPWFLLWGVAFITAMWRSRPGPAGCGGADPWRELSSAELRRQLRATTDACVPASGRSDAGVTGVVGCGGQ